MDFDFKRMMVAVLLCMMIMLTWQMYVAKKQKPQPDKTPATPATSSPKNATPTLKPEATAETAPPQEAVALQGERGWHLRQTSAPMSRQYVLGELIARKGGYKAQITLDAGSAAISQALLSEHKYKITDKKPGYPLLTPVLDDQSIARNSLMLGSLKILGRNDSFNLAQNCWRLTSDVTDPCTNVRAVTFSASIVDQQDKSVLDISKTFTFGPDSYLVDFDLALDNKSAQPLQIESLEFFGPMGILREDPRTDSRTLVAAYLDRDGKFVSGKKQRRTLISVKEDETAVERPASSSLLWLSVANKYFASVLCSPAPSRSSDLLHFSSDPVTAEVMYPTAADIEKKLYTKTIGARAWLKMDKALAPQTKMSSSFQVYLGPIDQEIFDHNPKYAGLHFDKLSSRQTCCTFCAFSWLTTIIFKMMKGIYLITGNYGVAIIVLVLLVRLLLHPITKKSQVNMMKMQTLSPQMEEIKTKYAGNKEEIQKRTMQLYKEQGMVGNMVLGCLPMFLQFPIWIAIFTAAGYNVALRHQGLLPASWHWLNDLSAPDRLVPFSLFGLDQPIQLPFLGSFIGDIDAINLLPILLCIAMFLQTKFSPQSKMSAAANPQTAQQQKMMLYMMPVMMFLFFYCAPSGLNLYIMASTFGGLIEQHFIRKHLQEEKAKAEVGTTTATTKISSRIGPKKKKPKPPFKYM